MKDKKLSHFDLEAIDALLHDFRDPSSHMRCTTSPHDMTGVEGRCRSCYNTGKTDLGDLCQCRNGLQLRKKWLEDRPELAEASFDVVNNIFYHENNKTFGIPPNGNPSVIEMNKI